MRKFLPLLCTLLASCSETTPLVAETDTSDTRLGLVVPADLTSDVVQPTPTPVPYRPPHNYDEIEGKTYFYVGAVSEKDREEGRAVGSVSGFRYMGRNSHGEHIIASVLDSGAESYRARCAEECVLIKTSYGSRIPYSPASIIGAAFQDAISGRLKQWIEPRPPEPIHTAPVRPVPIIAAEASEPEPELAPPTGDEPGEMSVNPGGDPTEGEPQTGGE